MVWTGWGFKAVFGLWEKTRCMGSHACDPFSKRGLPTPPLTHIPTTIPTHARTHITQHRTLLGTTCHIAHGAATVPRCAFSACDSNPQARPCLPTPHYAVAPWVNEAGHSSQHFTMPQPPSILPLKMAVLPPISISSFMPGELSLSCTTAPFLPPPSSPPGPPSVHTPPHTQCSPK